MYCVDESVVVNAHLEHESSHTQSKRFMDSIMERRSRIIAPEILIPEVSSAIARGTHNPSYALDFVTELRKTPHLSIVPIERSLSNLAATIAAHYELRGADSLYAAVSLSFKVKLISLDKRQLQWASALTPGEELKNIDKQETF